MLFQETRDFLNTKCVNSTQMEDADDGLVGWDTLFLELQVADHHELSPQIN